MNTYSRALRHISMKDVKQKHQEKLIEKKILEEKKKEVEKYITSIMEEKKYDWRKKLNEGMTSSGTFFTTLPATGDVEYFPTESEKNSVSPGPFLSASAVFDTSRYDTMTVDVIVYDQVFAVLDADQNFLFITFDGSGTYSFRIPQGKNQLFYFAGPDDPEETPVFNVTDIRFKRRTPLNVFVSLDSPEASSFIRTDPMMANLSPQERLKKLKEMIESSDEYVMKMLGLDFPGTGSVPPGEYDPFKQAPPGEAGDTPGVEISQLYPADYDMERNTDTMLLKGLQRGDYGTGPAIDKQIQNIMKNMQRGTPGGLPKAQASQDTQIAADYTNQGGQRVLGPHTDVKYDKQMKMFVPSNPRPGALPVRVAHYEPEGQVLSEKKLKSPEEILSKIPGYYDGKPAPLGFPVEPPPEMVNGMHPDLVDGKKVADRFNRLDPESAKAMPPTGNPHIDKKVKAARKKPK